MKTKLLSIFLVATCATISAQTLDSETFDNLTIGNFGADITGVTPGQGGFLTFASNGTDPTTTTNAAASNFQVIAAGNNGTQGAQITTPDGDKGARFLFKLIDTEWGSRTSGNDIIELQFSFFTGSATTSRAPFRASIFGTNAGTNVTIAAVQYNPVNQELLGLATLTNAGSVGFFNFNLGPNNTDLILPADTWVSVGCSYDTATGLLRWKTSFNDTSAFFDGAANVITGMVPNEIDFLSFGVAATTDPAAPANAIATNYVIDDYIAKASADDTLLSVEDLDNSSNLVSLFPNPAQESVTLNSKYAIEKVALYNLSGQLVFEKNDNFELQTTLNISNLNDGVYLMNISSVDGKTETKKLIKN